MGKIDNTDIEDVEQKGKFRQIKARWNAWKTKWEDGRSWGIVGGSALKNLPDTVLDQALEHGKSSYARDRARTIEGLGDLLEAVNEIIDGDVILTEHFADLEDSVKQMRAVLKVRKWNPRNIPFNTVIDFTEGGEGEKPTITRGKVYGHYRTAAYNKYAEWKNSTSDKETKIGLAESDPSWYNEKMGQAKPPLWLCITGEESDGMLAIADDCLEAVKKIKVGGKGRGPIQYGIFNNKGPEILSQIPSVQQHVRDVMAMPDIYPRGKQRAPVKDRLNQKFSGHTYSIANEEEARLFSQFIKGWGTVVGLEKVKTVRLRFPKNNLALNKLIKLVLGDEMNTFQKPGTTVQDVKPGLTLKSLDISKRASSVEEMLQRKMRCNKPNCPYSQYRGGGAEVTVNQSQSCSKRNERGCVGNTKQPQQGFNRR